MDNLGVHFKFSPELHKVPIRARKVEANSFSFFIKNPHVWTRQPLSISEKMKFSYSLIDSGYSLDQVLVHGGYLPNLGDPFRTFANRSFYAIKREMELCVDMGLRHLVLHPGACLQKEREDEVIKEIAVQMKSLINEVDDITLILEFSAGVASNVGYSLDHFKKILSCIGHPERTGVCLDTCHFFVSGYDFSTRRKYNKCLSLINESIGIAAIKALHINDSRNGLGSRQDGHASIGKGAIRTENLNFFIQDPHFRDLPMILETPNEYLRSNELQTLREASK